MMDFAEHFTTTLSETAALLRSGGLRLHPQVFKVTLHGSRGPAGGARPDSDIDLCLLVDVGAVLSRPELEHLLREVLHTTLDHWRGPVELDLAAVYDIRECGLRCFECAGGIEEPCVAGGVDCFGLYKIQKGFHGFVENAGIEVQRMYPCITVWEAPRM